MGQSVPDTPQTDPAPFLDRSSLVAMGLSALESSLVILGRAPFIRSRPFST